MRHAHFLFAFLPLFLCSQASAVVVFDTLGVPGVGGFFPDEPNQLLAQPFVLGDNDTVTSVSIDIGVEGSPSGAIHLEIWDDSGSGFPGESVGLLGSLDVPNLGVGNSTQVVNSPVLGLTQNEPYYLVMSFENIFFNNSNHVEWRGLKRASQIAKTNNQAAEAMVTGIGTRIWYATRNYPGGGPPFPVYNYASIEAISLSPSILNGSGETYFENFDGMETKTSVVPQGWTGVTTAGSQQLIDSLGLVNGPLDGVDSSATGLLNVGGKEERFVGREGRLPTWQTDLDRDKDLNESDTILDAAEDRALGIGRSGEDDTGSLAFEIVIDDAPLRAFTLDWDLEIWGGDPNAALRGSDGGGFSADMSVGGTSYYSQTVSFKPGELFTSEFDGDTSPKKFNPTLINGNEHAVRGNASGIVEVNSTDGAVGNTVNLTFDANHGNGDAGWISAVDNVRIRALAAGDAQGDGDVDPLDLSVLLGANTFGKGNVGATWAQGDFDDDGDFDAVDVAAILQAVGNDFPKTFAVEYSSEAGFCHAERDLQGC